MPAILASRLLRTMLLVDAAASGGVAALQLFAGPLLAGLLALPAMLLLESGIFMVVYAAFLLAMARSARLSSWLVMVVVSLLCTPRVVMHWCAASITTATPFG